MLRAVRQSSGADARQDDAAASADAASVAVAMRQARQALIVRGLLPTLADPAESFSSMRVLSGEEFNRYGGGMLGAVIHRAGGMGLVTAGDRVVVVQRLGDTAVVKIGASSLAFHRCFRVLTRLRAAVEYSGNPTLPQVHSTAEFNVPQPAAPSLAPSGAAATGIHFHYPRHASAASISEDSEA
jgi:hypothetical protein